MHFRDTIRDLPRQADNLRRKIKSATTDTRWLYKLDKPGKQKGKRPEELLSREIQQKLDELKEWKVPGRPPERLSLKGERALERLEPEEIEHYRDPDKCDIDEVKYLRHELLLALRREPPDRDRTKEIKRTLRQMNSILKIRHLEKERQVLVEQIVTIRKRYEEANNLYKRLQDEPSSPEQMLKEAKEKVVSFDLSIKRRNERIADIEDIFLGKDRINTDKDFKISFKGRFKEHWKKRFDWYQEKSKKLNLEEIRVDIETSEQFIEALHQKARDIVKDSRVWISQPKKVVDNILKDGRFKTSFETRSKERDYRKNRVKNEKKYLGYPEDTPPKKRPLYAFLSNDSHPESWWVAEYKYYVVFRFKDTITETNRVTVSEGNSLDNDKVNRVLYNKPDATMFQLGDKNPLTYKTFSELKNPKANLMLQGPQIEAQIDRRFRDVTLDDIDAVYFINPADYPDQQRIEAFKKLNIEVWAHNDLAAPYQRIDGN